MSVKIIQGEDRTLTVLLKNDNGTAFDLTGVTQILACFVNGTDPAAPIEKNLSPDADIVVVEAVCGKLTIKLEDADTLLLDCGTQGFTITLTLASGDLRKINLANSIIVEEAIC